MTCVAPIVEPIKPAYHPVEQRDAELSARAFVSQFHALIRHSWWRRRHSLFSTGDVKRGQCDPCTSRAMSEREVALLVFKRLAYFFFGGAEWIRNCVV